MSRSTGVRSRVETKGIVLVAHLGRAVPWLARIVRSVQNITAAQTSSRLNVLRQRFIYPFQQEKKLRVLQ
jgi:hypothetical protein